MYLLLLFTITLFQLLRHHTSSKLNRNRERTIVFESLLENVNILRKWMFVYSMVALNGHETYTFYVKVSRFIPQNSEYLYVNVYL